MENLIDDLSYMFMTFFRFGDSSDTRARMVQRLVDFMISDPLILAAFSLVFVGFVVGIFFRIFKSS